MNGNISIVIGSWGSYNECNERALGSKWLDLSDYSDWDEIVEELKKEGFELDGIDEELFIQDVEGIEDRSVNWDYVNPETLFNTLKESFWTTITSIMSFVLFSKSAVMTILKKKSTRTATVGTIVSIFGAVIRGKITDVKCLTAAVTIFRLNLKIISTTNATAKVSSMTA